jgi:DNA invertase Pin-like site-specific DNA recombinase
MTKRYFGYIRVSTKRQGDGASLPEQKAAIETFAARHGLTVVKWFSETRTAAKAGRREFNDMLRELKRGRADGIIIHKIDRSARNMRDWNDVCDLVDRGIEVRFAHDDLDISTRAGRLTADILAAIASDFIRNNRDQVKLCMYGWVRQGFFPWPAPIGYLNAGKHKLKKIDPERGPLMAQGFRLYATGKYSLERLRHELAALGLTRRDGTPLTITRLAVLLRNPFYCGLIRTRSGEIFEGKHEPLITKKLFTEVQAVLDGRVFPRTAQPEFTFRRLLRCGSCPRTLTAERQKGHAYYRCHGRTCQGVCVSDALVNEQVVRPILDLLAFSDEELEDIRDIARNLQARETSGTNARQATYERDLARVNDRLTRLTDALLDGVIDEETFRDRKSGLVLERARLIEGKADQEPEAFWSSVVSRFEQGNTASNLYFQANEGERRRLIQSLGSNFTVHGKEVEFTLAFPFKEVCAHRSRSLSAHSRNHVRTERLSRENLEVMILSLAPREKARALAARPSQRVAT